MNYLGGKHRAGPRICEAILSTTPQRSVYVEPFVGAGGVLTHIARHFDTVLASDTMPDLIYLWRAMRDGWTPPETLTEAEWRELKTTPPVGAASARGVRGIVRR